MKVVNQLIRYFREHGALSELQLQELGNSGFWNPYEDYGDYDYAYDFSIDLADELDDLPSELSLPRRTACRQRTRGRKNTDAAEIAGRLRQLEPQWRSPLSSLSTVARQLEPCDSWEHALTVIRNADLVALQEALRQSLDGRLCSLIELSRALDLQDYRNVVNANDRGPAVKAYRTILSANDYNSIGKQAWILRQEPVGRVFNLLRAKQHVLHALYEIQADESGHDDMACHLRGNSASNLFWAFVIFYNATKQENNLWIDSDAQHELCPWPSEENVRRGGYYALQMARNEEVFEFVHRYLAPMFDLPQRGFCWTEPANWSVPSHWTNRQHR